ncbi:RAxF-45 family protein [Bacillaceae bacterium S4-13-58]
MIDTVRQGNEYHNLYIFRAITHENGANGIRVSFFSPFVNKSVSIMTSSL